MVRTQNRLASASVIAALAGLPLGAAATVFSFTATCNSNWYGECGNGVPCGGGGFQTFNNWGYGNCVGGLPTPGTPDDVFIGAAAVTLNGSAGINSLSNSSGGVLTWAGGDLTIASTFMNNGTVSISSGNKTLAADVMNHGVIVLHSGWTLALSNSVLQNLGQITFTGDKSVSAGVGSVTHQMENYSQVTKDGGGTASIFIPFHNDGTVDCLAGTILFTANAVTSTPTSDWPVAPTGAVRFSGCSFTGRLESANDGLIQIESGMNVPSDSTFHVTNNGLWWANGDLAVGVGETLTNSGIMGVGTGHKTITGSVVNTGTLTMRDGWSVTLADGFITNQSLLDFLGDKSLIPATGTASSLDNNATMRKTAAGTATIQVPVSNTAVVDTQSGTFLFQSTSVDSSGVSTWPVAAGGAVRFVGCSLSGLFAGANSGTFQIESGWSIPSDTTLNITGNGLWWANGDLSIASGETLTNAAVMGIGNAHKVISGSLVNTGTLTFRDGWNVALGNATITNNGVTDFLGDKTITPVSETSSSFVNNATVRKTSGGTANILVPFANNSLVDTQSGTMLFLDAPITSIGAASWPVAAAGVVRFNNCSHSGTFTGINSGVVQIEAGWTIPANTIMNIAGNGLWWANGDLGIAPGMTLTNLNVMGIGNGHKVISGNLVNAGTMTIRDGWNITLTNGNIVNNAMLDFLGDKTVVGTSGGITNNATIRKTNGGTVTIMAPLTNNATVDNLGGSLVFSGSTVNSSPSSAWSVVASGTNRFLGTTLSGRFAGANAGTFQLESGTAVSADTTLNITGNGVNWANGDINVAPGATLTNAGSMSVPSSHRTVRGSILNTGSMWIGASWNLAFDNGSLTNNGTIECSDNKTITLAAGPTGIINNALLRKTNGGFTSIDSPLSNAGLISIESGTLAISGAFSQSNTGTTRLAGGSLNVGAGQTFAGGKLEGPGTITGPVVNSGASVRPGGFNAAGTMAMTSSYTQQSGGWMEVEIAGLTPDTEFDRLTANTASLNGTLFVRFMNGFHPLAGDTFTVLTTSNATGRTGTFSNVSVLDSLDGLVIEVLYGANSATVHVLQCTPCTPCDPDVNCDGAVNGFDIEAMEQAVNGDFSNFCQPDSDFNHDGTTNGFDVESVEQVVNGGFCP
ncbi:hypothetical protein PHYC_00247 [Phycisphaerales bacterium]|nr:hypothetical protein PHYC_00247 [Phycisphaerales bacterium]